MKESKTGVEWGRLSAIAINYLLKGKEQQKSPTHVGQFRRTIGINFYLNL